MGEGGRGGHKCKVKHVLVNKKRQYASNNNALNMKESLQWHYNIGSKKKKKLKRRSCFQLRSDSSTLDLES